MEPTSTESDSGTPTTDTGSDTSVTDSDTGPTVPPIEVVSANCTLTDNALRVNCDLTLMEAGPAQISLSAKGLPTRTFSSADPNLEHSILGWGLVPETEYAWTAGHIKGTVTTGRLPSALAAASITFQGSADGLDAVLRPLLCSQGGRFFVMIDGAGRIIWFEQISAFEPGGFGGYGWSSEHETVLIAGSSGFVEQHVSGDTVLALAPDVDYTFRLHHDTDRWNDYRYLLFQRWINGYLVDGVHIFEGKKRIATWHMEDVFTPSGGIKDWSHGNGINVTDDGVIILSFLNLDAVVALDGDPDSKTFLEVLWHAGGGPGRGLPKPDYVGLSGAGEGFRRQHDASLVGDDLYVFDNVGQSVSRAIRMSMDDKDGTLPVTGVWSFQGQCPIQGGAFPFEGGMLASCTTSNVVRWFTGEKDEPAWSMRASCGGNGLQIGMNHGIPIRIGD